jgi:hypothetical protein
MDTHSAINLLEALREEIAALGENHPKNPMAHVPKAETQIPWICRTLDEAASALRTKKDPFGNPISVSQVTAGLNQLIKMVKDPSYITQMEMAYPGIGKPLEMGMEKLRDILADIG